MAWEVRGFQPEKSAAENVEVRAGMEKVSEVYREKGERLFCLKSEKNSAAKFDTTSGKS